MHPISKLIAASLDPTKDQNLDLNQEEEEAELHKKLNDSQPDAEEYIDNPDLRFESIKQRETLKRWQMNNSLMNKGYMNGRPDGTIKLGR